MKNFLKIWIGTICLMVFCMVVVGGVTRLTHSGLSIAEWKPIMGALPPVHEKDWQDVFQKYQQTPEYQKINQGMSLHEFKKIFFWEYLHRLLGRLIGVVFLVPYLFFLLTKRLQGRLAKRLALGFVLGGLEGVMGWLMVKSGLVNRPQVSHYRLAAHLVIAFLIFAWFFWILLGLVLGEKSDEGERRSLKTFSWILLGFTSLEVVYGAFVAGLKAGFVYNTFPTMDGEWLPTGFWALEPRWVNLFENSTSVQFIHRWIAMTLSLSIVGFYMYARRFILTDTQRRSICLLLMAVVLQVSLGISTLLLRVPLSLAVLHQAGAFVLFAAILSVVFTLRAPS